jgi:hypothetical protein
MRYLKIMILFLLIYNIYQYQPAFCLDESENTKTLFDCNIQTVTPDDENKPMRSYWIAGINLGTPGLVNFNLGYYWPRFGINTSISFVNLLFGIQSDDSETTMLMAQLNLVLKLYETKNLLLGATAVGAVWFFNDKNDPKNDDTILFGGPAIDLHYKWFFLELGIGFSREFIPGIHDNSTEIIPLVQIGYERKFQTLRRV